MKKIMLTFSFIFIFISLLTSQNNVWNGSTDNNWSTDSNWSLGHKPLATEDVKIWAAGATVNVDVNGVAKSVEFQGTTFSINSSVTLTIENSASYGLRCNGGDVTNDGTIEINTSVRNGILNQGTGQFTNNGTISINGTTGFYHGIDNKVDFENTATGVINIDNTENGSGIFNASGTQLFWNEGEINIGLNDNIGYYGIDNRAEFYNNGAIDIGSTSGAIDRTGIFNEADAVKFTNDAGSLTINNTGTNFPGIDNRSVFDNDNNSPITMGANVFRGIDNNGGTFNNINGTISIAKISDSAILNRNSASFTNQSVMDFSGNTTANKPCVDSRASFSNTGIIDINDSQGQGIVVYAGSSFSNTGAGEINIGNTATIVKNGLDNNGDFTNGGTLNIGSAANSIGGRGLYSTGTFNNDGGTININNTTTQGLYNNGGTFNNINLAEINIGLVAHCGHRGIDNNGTFLNEDVSGIYIQDVQYESIYTTGGVFSNYGTYKQVLPTGSFWAISGASGSSFINKSTGEIYSGKAINGSYFTQEGILNPGNSPGILQIDNGLSLSSTSVYNCEILGNGGANAGDQDQIRSTLTDGTTLDGTLALDFGAFTPASTDQFIVLEYKGTLSGTFSSITGLPANWDIDYGTAPGSQTAGKVFIYGQQSAIPIKLLSFDAKEYNGTVMLSWETASENNNDFFEIERSENGKDFAAIGKIDSKGDSRDIVKYSFIDKMPINGTDYYRLKQVDFDGRYEYSNVVNVAISGRELSIFPNPASDYIIIENVENWDNVTICDMKGDKVFLPRISNTKVDISNLKKGIYNIKEKAKKALRFIVK